MDEAHPPGRLEFQQALAADGAYGAWLRRWPVAVERQGTLFMHAGIDPRLEIQDVGAVTERVHAELERYDASRRQLIRNGIILPFFGLGEVLEAVREEVRFLDERQRRDESVPTSAGASRRALEELEGMQGWWVLAADGPLWFRGYALWSEAAGLAHLAELRRSLGVDHFVVAHSVTSPPGTIRTRFGGGVFLIDTGMLEAHYGGQPSALEIERGVFTAIYPGRREALFVADEPVLQR